ncbi:hypothetical protein [Marinobacter sp.]|uniref:hypothetical protein n=1 Tax=Marinobacter sp. TaxID=50741 RepID=UPI0034A529A5
MSMNTHRLIGLTQERAMEEKTGVTDLHIGWQYEYAQQQQKDPSGHNHQAPVVTWKREGVTYQCVPRLAFRVNVTETPWIRRVLGLTDDPDFLVDTEALTHAVETQLLTRGVDASQRPTDVHA